MITWLLLPIGLTLVVASWSGFTLASQVADIRQELGQRVIWLKDIQAVQEGITNGAPHSERFEQALQRLDEEGPAMTMALGRQAEGDDLRTLQAAIADGRLEEAVAPGHAVVRAIRRQTGAISRDLDGYWESLNRLVAWSTALSIGIMALLVHAVISRSREARLWQTLRRYADQRAAVAEARRGSAVARFRRDLQQVIEGLPVGVAVTADDVILYANPALARLLDQQAADDLVGQPLDSGVGIERSAPVALEWDDAPAALVVMRDRAEAVAAEARLRLSDRLASVGTMASGVAHEINNPLTWIVLDLDELALRLAGTPEATELVQPIQEGVSRIQQIVRDLSTLARGQAAPDRPTNDLAALLRSTARTVSMTMGESVRIEVPGGSGPAVAGPEAQLGQVFLNLIINAVEAIRTEATDPGRHVRVRVGPLTDTMVEVAISDDGPGIAPAHLDRLFDPFFTTKPVGDGTGLGLFICHQLVDRLGGRIDVDAPSRRGATFRVSLPLADAPNAAGSTLLVVDDDPMVGRAIGRLLAPRHRVMTVRSIADATHALAEDPFDTVLCARKLPDGSAWLLHDHLLRLGPDRADRLVVVLTGPPGPEDQERIRKAGIATLEKPIRPAEIDALVGHRP
ncbi:MAG: ATP-binding protein [Myxococcota bacterium]